MCTNSYWKRVEYEDRLLITRTNIVLVLNGMAGIAVSLKGGAGLAIIAAILAINVTWIYYAKFAYKYVSALIEKNLEDNPSPAEELRIELFKNKKPRVTRFVARGIPIILTLAWIAGVVLTKYPLQIFNSNQYLEYKYIQIPVEISTTDQKFKQIEKILNNYSKHGWKPIQIMNAASDSVEVNLKNWILFERPKNKE